MTRILDRNRGYETPADRNRAIKQLVRRGFDYFVCYKDTAADYALQYGVKTWEPGRVYVCR